MSVDPLRRVAVTGVGLVTPLGRLPAEVWDRWAEGRSAAAPITRLDARTLPVRIAGEVKGFDPRKEVKNRKLLRMMFGGEDFGFRAANDAISQSGIDQALEAETLDTSRCGMSIGCHKEGFRHKNLHDAFHEALEEDGTIDRQRFLAEGWARIPPQIIIEALPNIGLYYIAHEFKLQGPNYNLLSIGVGGLQSLSEAMHAVAEADAEVMVAGAFDSWVNWMCIGHNTFAGILSTSEDPAETVHRPFDVARSGSVPAEGAGLYVLEEWEQAQRRGVPIYGEVLSGASTNGVPSANDEAAAEALGHCIMRALEAAECAPDDIDLIQLHGDATPRGDWIEARGVRNAFGTRASQVPATTVKSATGLMGNASGPVEVAMALEALQRGEVLPIVNLNAPEDDLGLDLVRERRSGLDLRRAVVIQRAWPNLNAVLVVERGPL